MQFLIKGDRYIADVKLQDKRLFTFKLDTGSPFTVISLSTFCRMAHYSDKDKAKSWLLGANPVGAFSYTKHMSRLTPVYIRNVSIDGTVIPKMYLFVNVDFENSSSLIGTDFISACYALRTKADYCIELDKPDMAIYEDTFFRRCKKKDVPEIFELESEPVKTRSIASMFDAAGGGLNKDRPIV